MAEPIVFIVDDNESVRDSLCWLVESVGLSVRSFASGYDFLASFDPAVAGCLVLDIRMPGMGGLELQEQLNKLGSTLPIIFMTAHGEVPTAVKAFKGGAIDFIQKPYDGEVLLELIQKAVRHNTSRTEVHARIAQLTPREKEILDFVVKGKSSKTIAEDLVLSTKTVEAHRSSIMKKMQVKSASELVARYLSAVGRTSDYQC